MKRVYTALTFNRLHLRLLFLDPVGFLFEGRHIGQVPESFLVGLAAVLLVHQPSGRAVLLGREIITRQSL